MQSQCVDQLPIHNFYKINQSLLKSFSNNNYDTELAEIKDALVDMKVNSKELGSNKRKLVKEKKEEDKKIINFKEAAKRLKKF